jgi:hypothetical protein
MDRLGAARPAGLDDALDVEIGFAAGAGPIATASSAISTCSARRSASE